MAPFRTPWVKGGYRCPVVPQEHIPTQHLVSCPGPTLVVLTNIVCLIASGIGWWDSSPTSTCLLKERPTTAMALSFRVAVKVIA